MRITQSNIPPPEKNPAEGDIYKIVETFGKTFELRYGYYSDSDRHTEPDVIYPDFQNEPLYTDDGTPFVTMMQDACARYVGDTAKNADTTCADCKYFERGEEWFGVCRCKQNKKNE